MQTTIQKVSKWTMLAVCGLVFGCEVDENESSKNTELVNSPIVMEKSEWRKQEIKAEAPKEIEAPGRIYISGDLLFVNDGQAGFHIVDNSNASNPVKLAFVPLEYNTDVIVKEGVLFANTYCDMISFDISNPANPKVLNRLEDVFNVDFIEVSKGFNPELNIDQHTYVSEGEIVIGWEEKEQPVMNEGGIFSLWRNAPAAKGGSKSGSMARFATSGDYVYALDSWSIISFRTSDNGEFLNVKNQRTMWGAETLFSDRDRLFVGGRDGMSIYTTDGFGNLSKRSHYSHWTACDPVVVKGDFAYLTMSSGCAEEINELHVIDISNLSAPSLVDVYAFTHPLGLGFNGSHLYLCDDRDGLKVFDVNSKNEFSVLNTYKSIKSVDVIPNGDQLIILGDDGVYQYNCSDPSQLVLQSKL